MEPTINPMPPQQQPQQSDGSDINKFIVLQPGERILCQLKRHPFGLIGMYVSAGVIAAIILGAAVAVPTFLTGVSQQMKLAMVFGALILIALIMLYVYVGAYIYNGNRWIVTSDSITQIVQVGLFSKQTSQLSLANLEDVTVDQNGLLQSMFGFGTLRVESAGAHDKFLFPFCPNPSDNARKIIEAHEAYISNKPEETVTANRPLATTTQFNQPYQSPVGTPPNSGSQG